MGLIPGASWVIRLGQALLVAVVVLVVAPPAADAAGRIVPCPVPTGEAARYEGEFAPFRCHTAFVDPNGLVVILREGRAADEGRGPFGLRHASIDRGVGEQVIARVLSTARPVEGEQRRLHYIEEFRAEGEAVAVWVVVDRAPSRQAPDTRPFGVITAFCKSADGEPERCPAWVNAGSTAMDVR